MKKIRWDLIGIVGGTAGVLIAAVAVIRAGGPNRFLISGALIVVFGGMGYGLYKFLWQPRFNVRYLQKSGIPGKAKILEVHETNIAINNNPQLKLIIELKNSAGDLYKTTCKTIVSRAQPIHFQPGKEVSVKIDPKNEKNIMIDIY
jgi:hypothetical protein